MATEAHRKANIEWYHRNKAKAKAQHDAWVEKNPGYFKNYYESNKGLIAQKATVKNESLPGIGRAQRWRRRFGLSAIQYWAIWDEQGGLCRICCRPETRQLSGKTTLLAVDHCHTTGVIRGLLCHRCNRVLGLMRDDSVAIARASQYLGGTLD